MFPRFNRAFNYVAVFVILILIVYLYYTNVYYNIHYFFFDILQRIIYISC